MQFLALGLSGFMIIGKDCMSVERTGNWLFKAFPLV